MFYKIVVCLQDVHDAFKAASLFWEVSGFANQTSESCSEFAAEAVDVCDADLVVSRIAYDFAFVHTDYSRVDFVSDFLSKSDTIFFEMFENSVLVLAVSVGVEMDLVFIVRLLCALCDEFVELIGDFLYPFADGKCSHKTGFSFYVEVAVCVARFRVAKPSVLAPRLFFLTNVHSSSISCSPSLTS